MNGTRIGLAALGIAVFATTPAAARSRTSTAALRAALLASSVPVLLPQPLPRAFGATRSITVIDAGRAGYYVGFSPLAKCAGALSCAFFHIAGSPAGSSRGRAGSQDRRGRAGPQDRRGRAGPQDRRVRAGPQDRRVRLPDGTLGVFHPADCSGASCMEASLYFQRGGAVYELDGKVAGDSLRALESAYEQLRAVR